MTALHAFLAMLSALQAHTAGCTVSVGRSTAGPHVLYGGNCVQAFFSSIGIPDSLLTLR